MSRLPGTPEAGTEARPRTAIVTGASRGIGAGVTGPFIDLGYNVVANALHFADSTLVANANLALVEGNIGQASTAVRVTETAISKFGSIDAVVANADARQRLERILAKPIGNGRDLGNPGHYRCGRLSDRGTSCHRGSAARGRRCTQRKMVNTEDKLTTGREGLIEEM